MNVFITGITGTLGQAVSKVLLDKPGYHVFGYSRDEKKQSEIEPRQNLTLILGDVRDQRRLIESSRNCHMIFHFAALKRVDMMETNPEECIQTNVEGTINVLGAQRANKIPRVILSSTDKAVKPINVYGYSKALAEKLVLRNKNNIVVRYGNVLASRGSAIPDFIKAIKNGQKVNVTDVSMTRYFMKIDDAADFVIDSALGRMGGLYINKSMKACFIVELIDVLSEIIGKPTPKYNIIGMRPGEKMHEDLFNEFEDLTTKGNSFSCDHFSRRELRALLEPIVEASA